MVRRFAEACDEYATSSGCYSTSFPIDPTSQLIAPRNPFAVFRGRFGRPAFEGLAEIRNIGKTKPSADFVNAGSGVAQQLFRQPAPDVVNEILAIETDFGESSRERAL